MQTVALALFCHTNRMPTSVETMHVYSVLLELFDLFGVKPTHFSAYSGNDRGGYRSFGGKFHKNVLAAKTEGYHSIGLAFAPNNSTKPAYDKAISFSFVFIEENEEIGLTMTACEDFISLGNERSDRVVSTLSELWPWDYGFGFERESSTMPEVFLVGATSDRQSPEDQLRVEKWYNCFEPHERKKRIRDVFQYNIVNENQLGYVLEKGKSVHDYILNNKDSQIFKLENNLWLWKVSKSGIDVVRADLLDSGLIISV